MNLLTQKDLLTMMHPVGDHARQFSFVFVRRHPASTLFPYTTLFRSSIYRQGTFIFLSGWPLWLMGLGVLTAAAVSTPRDRKSTRLNSSHVENSYAVFRLKKKTDDHDLALLDLQDLRAMLQHVGDNSS